MLYTFLQLSCQSQDLGVDPIHQVLRHFLESHGCSAQHVFNGATAKYCFMFNFQPALENTRSRRSAKCKINSAKNLQIPYCACSGLKIWRQMSCNTRFSLRIESDRKGRNLELYLNSYKRRIQEIKWEANAYIIALTLSDAGLCIKQGMTDEKSVTLSFPYLNC